MAQFVASMSGVVLGGVVEVVGSNLTKYLQHLSSQLFHYISLRIYIHAEKVVILFNCVPFQNAWELLPLKAVPLISYWKSLLPHAVTSLKCHYFYYARA